MTGYAGGESTSHMVISLPSPFDKHEILVDFESLQVELTTHSFQNTGDYHSWSVVYSDVSSTRSNIGHIEHLRECVGANIADSGMVFVEPIFADVEKGWFNSRKWFRVSSQETRQYTKTSWSIRECALDFFALLILLLAVLRFQRIIRVLFNLLFDDILKFVLKHGY